MAWLEEEVKDKKKDVGECEAGDKLTEFRSLEQYYRWVRCRRYGCTVTRADSDRSWRDRGLAYDNISAAGPNGGESSVQSLRKSTY